MKSTAPILYLVFNRPEETAISFGILRDLKPTKLYVAADGPRLDKEGEEELCDNVRKIIIENVDWECELFTLFRDSNLGCGKAVQNAIDWFFTFEEKGIIIEDDILPDITFFNYASELLDFYENDERIFSINGCNLGYSNPDNSHGVTRYFNMWGWATWKRSNVLVNKSWSEFNRVQDFKLNSPIINSLQLKTIWPQEKWYALWVNNFKNTYLGIIDTWDYQWVYTSLKNELYCIRPNTNLIKNIGFNEKATHTISMQDSSVIDLKVSKILVDINAAMNFEIDPVYENEYVAKKWQYFKIDYKLFLDKVQNKFKRLFS